MLNPPAGVQTQDYIDALKADSLVHVRMSFTAQGITLTDQDIMADGGLTLSDILNGDIDLTFGRAVMKQLTVSIVNSSRVANLLWTDEFTLELGVDINNVTKWVKIGEFIGERPNNISNVSVIEYTAYDKMQRFDTLADDFWNSVTFPATVSDIYHDLCTYVGIGYVSGDELPYIMSRTFTAAPMQLQGYTCRDLLSWLAEACGCYAKVNADGNCKMVWYTDHSSSLAFALDDEFHIETADLYTGLIWDEFDEYYWNDADKLAWNDVCSYEEVYGLDSMQVRQLDSDINVNYPYASGGNVYMIVENPFLYVESADDIEYYIKPLWDRLSAFGGHLPINVECVGNWLVESGDIISVDVTDTMTVNAPVYIRTMKWNGSCRDVYETTGNVNRQEVSSDNRGKLIARNNIRFIARDLYYNIQSGIDIKPEGIEIIGGKYLKLMSGGVLDVQSTNFELSSADKKMVAGSWQFNDDGIKFENDSATFPFYMGKRNDSDIIPSNKPGLYYYVESEVGGIQLYACSKQNDDPYSASLELSTIYNSSLGKRVSTLYLFDNGGDSDYDLNIGGAVYPISTGYFINLKSIGGTISGNKYVYSTGLIYMYPRNVANSYIAFQEYTYNSAHYTKIYGSIGANMIFEGQHTAPSSRDIKHDIKNLESQGETIDKLNPVSFVYDNDPGEQKHYGLIYEDTIKVAPEVCTKDESSKAINYVELIPLLLKEIQDLRARVKTLEERLGEQ